MKHGKTIMFGLIFSITAITEAQGAAGQTGTFTSFDAPGAATSTTLRQYMNGTIVQDLNNAGQIVGFFYTDLDNVTHGFLRDRDGSIVAVDDPSAGTYINTSLSIRAGTIANAINTNGATTGVYEDPNGTGNG